MNRFISLMIAVGSLLVIGSLVYLVLSIIFAFPAIFLCLFLGLLSYSIATIFVGGPYV